jgi:hypothetical protein
MTRDRGVRETIHLVDLYKETEQKLYQGSYISQLVCNSANDYLYFLENENGDEVNRFKLMQLNIKTKKADTILVENYNNILLIQ